MPYKNTQLILLRFKVIKLIKDPIQITFYLFTFRCKANGKCLFSSFSIAMCAACAVRCFLGAKRVSYSTEEPGVGAGPSQRLDDAFLALEKGLSQML